MLLAAGIEQGHLFYIWDKNTGSIFFSVLYGLSSGIWLSKSTISATTSLGNFSTTYTYFAVCDVTFFVLKSALSWENHTCVSLVIIRNAC